MENFRAFKSAVSLKRGFRGGGGLRGWDFRAFKSAVSLKQPGVFGGAGAGVLFPRLQKRGLIEAAEPPPHPPIKTYFRAFKSAVSLKPTIRR